LSIFFEAGLAMAPYRYWDAKNRTLDIAGLVADLKAAPNGSIVLLHTCAHNPTGVDPTHEQWKQIAAVMKEKDHFPFFDSAYQGFATGDLDNDAWSLRYFVEQGFTLFCCQSFAKNMGLYGERTGTLSAVCKTASQARSVEGQLEAIARPMYSNPPKHGAQIAKTILKNPEFFAEWKEELKVMSGRIFAMRQALYNQLKKLGTPGTWEHVITQIGMFTFLGLTPQQCEVLISKYHIYLLKSSRISMAGLNTKNIEYFANAVHAVVTGN
jgi:aspartate/tyrosine/aromatic aminotransferase